MDLTDNVIQNREREIVSASRFDISRLILFQRKLKKAKKRARASVRAKLLIGHANQKKTFFAETSDREKKKAG